MNFLNEEIRKQFEPFYEKQTAKSLIHAWNALRWITIDINITTSSTKQTLCSGEMMDQ